jgi:hypothetical protein
VIQEGGDFPKIECLEIDFNPVQKIIEKEKNNSVNFLKNALK